MLLRLGPLRASAALYLLATAVAPGIDYVWDNSANDNDYSNPSNWVGNVAPVAGSTNYAVIGLTGTNKAIFSSGTSPNLAGLRIGTNGTNGELTQTGGTLNFTANTSGATRIGADGEVGTYLMSGGTATLNAVHANALFINCSATS